MTEPLTFLKPILQAQNQMIAQRQKQQNKKKLSNQQQDNNGGAGFKRDSIHRFTGHIWSAITGLKLGSFNIGVGQPWPSII
jgi:hypothetical protein